MPRSRLEQQAYTCSRRVREYDQGHAVPIMATFTIKARDSISIVDVQCNPESAIANRKAFTTDNCFIGWSSERQHYWSLFGADVPFILKSHWFYSYCLCVNCHFHISIVYDNLSLFVMVDCFDVAGIKLTPIVLAYWLPTTVPQGPQYVFPIVKILKVSIFTIFFKQSLSVLPILLIFILILLTKSATNETFRPSHNNGRRCHRRQCQRQRRTRACRHLLARCHHTVHDWHLPRPPRPLPAFHYPRRSHQPSARSTKINHSHSLPSNHCASSTYPHHHHHNHLLLSLESYGGTGAETSTVNRLSTLGYHRPPFDKLHSICGGVSCRKVLVEAERKKSGSPSCCRNELAHGKNSKAPGTFGDVVCHHGWYIEFTILSVSRNWEFPAL